MDAEFAKRWVAKLREPGLKQATGCLFDGSGYCCLGVAEAVAGSTFTYDEDYSCEDETNGAYVVSGTYSGENLSRDTAISIGMTNGIDVNYAGTPSDGPVVIEGQSYATLADANDKGCTFAQIADWIEANYHRL